MSADIQEYDKGVSLKSTDGTYQIIPTPNGYTTAVFRAVVAATDTAFRMRGKKPSFDDIRKVLPKVPVKTLALLTNTPEFREAMSYRGIDWEENEGLTTEQQMVLLKLSDPFDKRSLTAKLKDMGIPMPKFQNWQKNPLFSEVLEAQSVAMYKDALPAIRSRLVSEAESGKQWAAEMVLAKTGEWNPRQAELENAQQVVLAMVEAIVKHVADPNIRAAIAADVGLSASTMQSIEGKTNI
jgi:hypothetical protein